jgi:pimeloyl-ACP methyl ester carboxylesterase
MLHGFPEFWYGWRKQIPALARAGWRVVAPDQRGYNLSDKPRAIRPYHLDLLAGDIAALIGTLGYADAAVAGHDWGAGVAWWLALMHPARVRRLAILNGPHPAAFRTALRASGRQRRLSWYILFFQIPWLPEALGKAGGWRGWSSALVRSANPGTFSAEDLARYRSAWSQPGATRSMLNWYRALRFLPALPRIPVEPPTLILWGAQDRFLDAKLAQASAGLCRHARVRMFDHASHWVHLEEAEDVNAELLSFFGGPE